MNMLYTKYAMTVCLIIFGVTGCSQEPQDLSLPMKAGEYQVDVTKIADGVTAPVKRSRAKCFREPNFDPFKSYHQNKDCKATNIKKSSDKVSFDIDCKKGEDAQMKGSIEYGVAGDKFDWAIKLNSMNNQEIDVETMGTGEYIGKCR